MDPSVHVTAVIADRVRPGRETGYAAWLQEIAADARGFQGYLGAHILRPELGVSPDHVIVVQFETCQELDSWMQSETRREWIKRVKPLIREPETIKVPVLSMSPPRRAPTHGFPASWPRWRSR